MAMDWRSESCFGSRMEPSGPILVLTGGRPRAIWGSRRCLWSRWSSSYSDSPPLELSQTPPTTDTSRRTSSPSTPTSEMYQYFDLPFCSRRRDDGRLGSGLDDDEVGAADEEALQQLREEEVGGGEREREGMGPAVFEDRPMRLHCTAFFEYFLRLRSRTIMCGIYKGCKGKAVQVYHHKWVIHVKLHCQHGLTPPMSSSPRSSSTRTARPSSTGRPAVAMRTKPTTSSPPMRSSHCCCWRSIPP